MMRRAALARMRSHARALVGRECCGALLGRVAGDARVIEATVPLANESAEPTRRYLIRPSGLRRLERRARVCGLEVLGFYHSHPDGSPRPSRADVADAWPWFTYVIVPARRHIDGEPMAWRLRGDRSRFDPEPIEFCA